MTPTAATTPPASTRPARLPLARPRTCLLGGVSVAVADHLGWPVVAVRWIFVGTTLLSGMGALLYLWLWALTPLRSPEGDEPAEGVRRRIHIPWILGVAGVLSGFAAIVLALAASPGSATSGAAVGALSTSIAALVGAVAWDQLVDDDSVAPVPVPATAFRIACGAFLVVIALVISVIPGAGEIWFGVIAATFAGAAVIVAPWALRLWRELIAERTARIKEEQRAEMAAHLHDSVLQTLALIQNRAGASSEVGRIARAQERELRDWLYADADRALAEPEDLAAELREVAAALEVDHPAHFELVTVGEPVRQAPSELAAAAREAMLNAARHAGGEVSVYVESTGTAVDVFVRDRGRGFDMDALPEGRLGVRESIVGRMRRAGGHAVVTSRPTGTEVHLSIELPSEAA